MRTPAQKKASSAYAARRRERGDKLVRVWLNPEFQKDLAYLAQEHGSIEKAVCNALDAAAHKLRRAELTR